MQTLRFGKLAAKHDYRTLRFSNYLKTTLPAPPATFDALQDVFKSLGISDPKALFPMDGNDQYGDCTIAAVAHAITVFNGKIGKKKIWGTVPIEKLYFKLTGGADSGLDELNVLNYWQSNKIDGDEILAFVKIDQKNHDHIKSAIQLFGGVYLGFQVQQNCLNDFNNGKEWTPGRLTNEGHAVYATGYDDKSVTVLTWGTTQKGTWAWWDECVDEAYAVLPPEAENSKFTTGFDFAQLKEDLNAVAG
jgi:hypothetical protein